MSSKKLITYGSDFEFFLQDADKNLVPSCGLLGGTKEKPRPLPGSTGYFFQEDNIMAELNIPPCGSLIDVLALTNRAYREFYGNILAPKKLGIKMTNHVRVTPEILAIKGAQQIGCSPDNDAYREGMAREPWHAAQLKDLRFAGGHIWMGYDKECEIPPHVIAMFMDSLISLPLIKLDKQGERRKFYGQAGIFRTKETEGQRLVEYRTPSNVWTYSRRQVQEVFLYADHILRELLKDPLKAHKFFSNMPWNDVRVVINEEDSKLQPLVFGTMIKNLQSLYKHIEPIYDLRYLESINKEFRPNI